MRQAGFTLALASLAAATSLGACTPGAATAPTGGSGAISNAIVIHVSLLKYMPTSSAYGQIAGYSPNPITVPKGSVVQFVNDDNFLHTATFVSTTAFTPGPLPLSSTSASGSDLATPGWSSGDLQGGTFSQGFTASTSGTYYYGCYHHYGSPMRGVIVVQ